MTKCRGSGQILNMWLYKVVDNEVRVHILKDLGGELKEVEDSFFCSEYDMKGHFFRGVKMRRLKINIFKKIEIISLMKLVETIVRFLILSHISL